MSKTGFLNWKQYAKGLKTEIYALYLAYQDPRTPWYARVFAACVAAYAFSPIDLIPDFIPILGYLDDLILLPIGIFFALKLIPPPVLAESRLRAAEVINQGKPLSKWGAALIVIIWIVSLGVAAVIAIDYFNRL
jgi:uncharacterized membrane protein YkvA (DUF1232 family)